MTVTPFIYHEAPIAPPPIWTPEPRTERNWIQTYTGRQFWPLDPRAEDICIEDIAHALANTCRYTGHCDEFYSVAEHSVRVSYRAAVLHMAWDKSPYRAAAARLTALAGLLHDASEAYISDVSRPVKHSATFGPIYQAIEANLERVIEEAFDLPPYIPDVKQADNELLATEKRDLMGAPPRPWITMPDALPAKITPWTSDEAEHIFLYRFHALNEARKVANL